MKTRTKVTLDEILKTKTWLGSFLGPAQGSEGSLDFWRWRESEYSPRYFRVATASVVMSFCYNHDKKDIRNRVNAGLVPYGVRIDFGSEEPSLIMPRHSRQYRMSRETPLYKHLPPDTYIPGTPGEFEAFGIARPDQAIV